MREELLGTGRTPSLARGCIRLHVKTPPTGAGSNRGFVSHNTKQSGGRVSYSVKPPQNLKALPPSVFLLCHLLYMAFMPLVASWVQYNRSGFYLLSEFKAI